MKFKNIKIDVQNANYADLCEDMKEKISENVEAPLGDGYDNYADVEVVCWLGDEFYTIPEMVRDLKVILDLTNEQFNKLKREKAEVSFYISYEA